MNREKEVASNTGNDANVHAGGSEHENDHTQPQANENASSSAETTSAVMLITSSNTNTPAMEASPSETLLITNIDDTFTLNADTQVIWTQGSLSYDEEFGVEWDNNQINDADVPQKNLLAGLGKKLCENWSWLCTLSAHQRRDLAPSITTTHPFFTLGRSGATQESNASETQASSSSSASKLPPVDPLADLLRPRTPDGYKDLEKDLWHYSKTRLRCTADASDDPDSACNGLFINKSGCGNPTPFGVRLISIQCSKCSLRPRLRDTCLASKFDDIREFGLQVVKLDDYLRIHWNRKTAPTTQAQAKKHVSSTPTPQPLRTSDQFEPVMESAPVKSLFVAKQPAQPQTNKHQNNKAASQEAATPSQPWHEIEDDPAMDQDSPTRSSGAGEATPSTSDLLETIKALQEQRKADAATISSLLERVSELERALSARVAPKLPPELAAGRSASKQTGTRSKSRGRRTAANPPEPIAGPSGPSKTFAQAAATPAPRRAGRKVESRYDAQVRNAKTDEELAKLVTRRGAFPGDVESNPPSRPRAESIKSFFVNTNFLRREAKRNGPIKAIRAVFKSMCKLPYIDEISPLGKGISICEIFYDGRYDDEVKSKLREQRFLLEGFNPFEVPFYMVDTTEENVKERFCARRAGIYRRGRFELLRKAALAGANSAMQKRILELAKGTPKTRA
ncbi:hypothetical protein HDU80_000785 [Chytriomyces hyalinus]|nr:hypothetical protein HDU80_000785 [Chytriomyces hyalinus]